MKIPFVGPSYVYPSINFDAQRSINQYPAKSETGTSKDSFIMCPTPGRVAFAMLPVQPIRAEYTTSTGRAFAVAYNKLYEIFSDGSYSELGTINTFTGNVSMADNGLELMIVDGTVDGWILTLSTDVFQQISDMDFEGGVTVCFIGGYFMVNRPDTGIYQISELYDGLDWDSTQFANAEGSPDNLVAVVTLHQQVALIGSNTTQFAYASGASPFPIDLVQGVFIEYGCSAAFTVQQVANTVFWVGNDKDGADVVWMADGYQPRRISTEAIEAYLSRYDLTDATSLSYQENGHYFYQINIPSAPTSVVYDITTESWHERARWNTASAAYERDRANFHMFAFGKHLVSDYETGIIYEQSLSYNDDDGVLVRRERTLPYVTEDDNLDYIYFKRFQVDMQTGVGLTTGAIEDTNPMAIISWSDDGGHTWSNEWNMPIGKIGQYKTRVKWDRLGRSRFRIFKLVVVANVKCYMIAAHILVERGYA